MNSIYNSSGQRVGEYDGSTVYLAVPPLNWRATGYSAPPALSSEHWKGSASTAEVPPLLVPAREAVSIRTAEASSENTQEIRSAEQRHCFSGRKSYSPDSFGNRARQCRERLLRSKQRERGNPPRRAVRAPMA